MNIPIGCFDPLLRAQYDKSRQPIVRAKSFRLRKFSVWKRRTSDDDVPEIASIKQKLKEKLKKGKKKFEAALETAAHKAEEVEVRQKSWWPEVLATPREKSFYQQPAISRAQPHQLQNKYHLCRRSLETPMIYKDVRKTPKGYQVRDRDATTELYNGDSHSFNEAVEPRELTMRSPPNKARLAPPGRRSACMDNVSRGWKGWAFHSPTVPFARSLIRSVSVEVQLYDLHDVQAYLARLCLRFK
ncbi:fungal specific transcription factor [Colletotrichum scovillei]|uniref:Fungal specific transcription factor n=1 Tax=Colletotrichum scovillei TaxID=1209932 RepID=A0A9P7UML7_9PEZI|nr:fungal specific transcription factor [Colletotrichum scovillei]KAG7077747.1 fungal specific transcription factor [Colletotrichum scovillei]KAG7084941.1 fungal specific transcription factor [Colletotrichum scovillei]